MQKVFWKTAALLCIAVYCAACKNAEDSIAVVWTDRTDFITYCEAFNSAQSRYKITMSYKQNPADALMNTQNPPDLVVGPWLRGDAALVKFVTIDTLLSEKNINPDSFYPLLRELGNVNGKQYLLPVSFNLPAIIFSASQQNLPKTNFTLSLEEMQELSAAYNKKSGTDYTRMGFSPRWDTNFLYVTAQGMNAAFEETKNLFSWNDKALQDIIAYTRTWSETVNTNAAAEDEFQFRDLRAKAGTDKDEEAGLSAAKDLLGHKNSSMTVHYVRHRKGKLVNPTRMGKFRDNVEQDGECRTNEEACGNEKTA